MRNLIPLANLSNGYALLALPRCDTVYSSNIKRMGSYISTPLHAMKFIKYLISHPFPLYFMSFILVNAFTKFFALGGIWDVS